WRRRCQMGAWLPHVGRPASIGRLALGTSLRGGLRPLGEARRLCGCWRRRCQMGAWPAHVGRPASIGRSLPFGPPRLVRLLRPRLAVQFADNQHLVTTARARPSVPRWRRLATISGVSVGGRRLVVDRAIKLLFEPGPRGDAPDELRVTRDHFDPLGRKPYVSPGAVLDSLPTAFANRDRDLIGAAPGIGRSPQNLARHLEKK